MKPLRAICLALAENELGYENHGTIMEYMPLSLIFVRLLVYIKCKTIEFRRYKNVDRLAVCFSNYVLRESTVG
jgi:hypothetical protein